MTAALAAVGPVLLAALAAAWFDLRSRRAGLDPPGFDDPLRRWAGLVLLATCFWIAVFASLGGGSGAEIDLAAVADWQLFALHAIFLLTLLGWFALGFGGRVASGSDGGIAAQLGLVARAPGREIGLGLVFGIGAWLVVLAGVVALALAISALGGQDWLPTQPPEMIPWLAGRPVLLRLAIALSAGIVEEIFFRGFLQPRVGIGFSTLLFALAHAAYGQPFLLVGVTLLSLLYAGLVRWRQSIWAAIAAHALFDAIQLLVVIPAVLDTWSSPAAGN